MTFPDMILAAEIDALVSKCDGRIIKVALYTHPTNCPRCAELEPVVHAIGNFIGREYLVAWTDKFLSDIVIQLLTERDKQLAALEAENKHLTERIKQIDALLASQEPRP